MVGGYGWLGLVMSDGWLSVVMVGSVLVMSGSWLVMGGFGWLCVGYWVVMGGYGLVMGGFGYIILKPSHKSDSSHTINSFGQKPLDQCKIATH